MYASIIINNEAPAMDRLFTYKVPKEYEDSIKVGYRVKVPFGGGNKTTYGIVAYLKDSLDEEIKGIKEIYQIVDKIESVQKTDIDLIEYMREKYLCTYLDGIRTIVPFPFESKAQSKIVDNIVIKNSLVDKYDKEPYKTIYEIVKNNNGKYTKTILSKKFNISISSINTMVKHGFLSTESSHIDRVNENRTYVKYDEKKLNDEQKKAYDTILDNSNNVFCLHGVTGSGKTEIYMQLVSNMLDSNKESIILVPEISLTPQMIERFKGRFGSSVAIFHSRLSTGERYDEWLKVKEGKVKVAIGARSAIFLPFTNLGLIVIDEEHEATYKSESNPKYDAREIAEYKSTVTNCKVVLGSATPSVETYYRCEKNDIHLIEIFNRAVNSNMPTVEIVDMREELRSGNKSMFSKPLFESMKQSLMRNEQVILFLNRRGFSSFISCRECGYVYKCDKCDISYTYHISTNILKCHYCGGTHKIVKKCDKCGSKYVKYFGVGTEKVQEAVSKVFPGVKCIRMDFDTTRTKNAYEFIYNSFKNKEAQILIGTQMIAKGLDFKDVSTVGVLAADLSLNMPHYKATERTFQLLTQVSGRAGRGEISGKVIVQTYSPSNFSIISAASHDYKKFYKEEIMLRHLMDYPPFSKLFVINLSSKDEDLLIKESKRIGEYVESVICDNENLSMLGPCPCGISKIKDVYRWQIIIKGHFDNTFTNYMKNEIFELTKQIYKDVKVSLYINPNNLL